MEITAFQLASRFIGIKEISGSTANPQIMSMLKLDDTWPEDDAVPWCSAFLNYICWLLRLPRSKSLMARSWLNIGMPVEDIDFAKPGFDIVVSKRGGAGQPGPEVLNAPGHVGLFGGSIFNQKKFYLLAGNQNDMVNISIFDQSRVLGVRRLA